MSRRRWNDRPRLLCIAGDLTDCDQHAVKQINRNIEPIRYRYYGDDLLLELGNATKSAPAVGRAGTANRTPAGKACQSQDIGYGLAQADRSRTCSRR